jgi:GntR family transcriptional regulator
VSTANLAVIGLDRHSPVPLYFQLAATFRAQIQAGALAAGQQLPAERDLAREAGISRMTARQALAELAHAGDIVVRHGIGAFVAAPKLTHDAVHLLGFTEEMEDPGGDVATRVLECDVIQPPPDVRDALHLADDGLVIRIVRLRSTGAAPLLLETSYVPHARCPGLEHENLERQSLYRVLEQRCGLLLHGARQTIEATAANTYESDLLGVDEGAPMLLLRGVASTADGEPIEWFKAIYRADRVRIALDSQREQWGGAVRPIPPGATDLWEAYRTKSPVIWARRSA